MPGYDRETKEFVRRLAVAGYHVVAPNLYSREAPGADPDDAAATARAAGGVPDERLVGDVAGAAEYLRGAGRRQRQDRRHRPLLGWPAGVSGGCSLRFDAAVDCYGAFVVEDPPEGMPAGMKPILGLAPDLSCPLLGLFGKDDRYPSPGCGRQTRRRTRTGWARTTSSTPTTAQGTRSSPSTARPTA